jgi:hypothetical protein
MTTSKARIETEMNAELEAVKRVGVEAVAAMGGEFQRQVRLAPALWWTILFNKGALTRYR